MQDTVLYFYSMNHLARAAAWGREEFSLSEQGQLLVCGFFFFMRAYT